MSDYSEEERRLLLNLAREAICASLDKRQLDLSPPNEHLAEHRGAFTTLHIGGELRGCVGYVFSAVLGLSNRGGDRGGGGI